MNYNQVTVGGRLTRDIELKYSAKGTAIAKIGMATSRKWKGEDGALHEETTFLDVDAFSKQAETLAQYLKKGDPVFIIGRLKLDQWEDKDTGQKRQKLGVVMEQFRFISNKRQEENPQPAEKSAPAPAPSTPDEDDSVPF